ncbi:MAG: hypothetical protein U1C33_04645, partial [Candidatus Cloacimonadaceae bacterium]|nr:hypothetical protein [Candidatus Cloacimonadaceae bacterium]
MKRLIFSLLILLAFQAAFAQGFSISTPEGNISMTITGIDSDGKTKSGNVIDMIAAKLEELEKNYHTKLNKLDQKRAQNIVEEIYNLLALLPYDANVVLTTSSSSTSTTTTTTTQPNININISGSMVEEKPAPVVKEKPQKPKPVVEEKPASGRKLIGDKDFNDLIGRIGKESFSDDKLRV